MVNGAGVLTAAFSVHANRLDEDFGLQPLMHEI